MTYKWPFPIATMLDSRRVYHPIYWDHQKPLLEFACTKPEILVNRCTLQSELSNMENPRWFCQNGPQIILQHRQFESIWVHFSMDTYEKPWWLGDLMDIWYGSYIVMIFLYKISYEKLQGFTPAHPGKRSQATTNTGVPRVRCWDARKLSERAVLSCSEFQRPKTNHAEK